MISGRLDHSAWLLGALLAVGSACEKKQACVSGLDDATCTPTNRRARECDACGQSWFCLGNYAPDHGRWIKDSTPCECVCADGGILNSPDDFDPCFQYVGEHLDHDTGPYRETCDDPRWDE